MPIANDTQDDVLYTVGDPGHPVPLASGTYRCDDALHEGALVRFFSGTEELAMSEPLKGSNVLVVLKRSWENFQVGTLVEQT